MVAGHAPATFVCGARGLVGAARRCNLIAAPDASYWLDKRNVLRI
jgi:hypothetical protein